MFARLAIATLLRLLNPTCPDHKYTLAEMTANNPYTVKDWQYDVDRRFRTDCRCITIKISPDGTIVETSRTCACEE